jgi:hypothetical protein
LLHEEAPVVIRDELIRGIALAYSVYYDGASFGTRQVLYNQLIDLFAQTRDEYVLACAYQLIADRPRRRDAVTVH